MFTRSIEIPEIQDVQNINLMEFEKFKRIGACYIKIPCSVTSDALANIRNVAKSFFASSSDQKKRFHTRAPKNELGKSFSTGYADRSTYRSKFESYRQKIGDEALPLFVNNTSDLEVLKQTIVDLVILKLALALPNFLDFSEEGKKQLGDMTSDAKAMLQLNYCPKRNFYDKIIKKPSVAPHKDISLISIISNENPGLCIWHNGTWHDVLPRQGYLVAVFGKLANSITLGQINSPLHVVKDVEATRLSTVLFFAGKASSSVYSMNGKLLGKDLTHYEAVLETTLTNRRENIYLFVNNLYIGINFMLLLGLIFKFTLGRQDEFLFSNFHKKILTFALSFTYLNASLFLMNRLYFERIILDYLQYADIPNYATESEMKAYKLGASGVTFFGMANGFMDRSTYDHRSFWNAGFLSSLLPGKN
jgi:isopenicillin N synthase-like dioxygenase